MDVPAEFFSRMTLIKAVAEDRAANGSAPARRVHIFEFSLTKGEVELGLQFETRDDLSSLKAPYPSTFDVLKVKRAGN